MVDAVAAALVHVHLSEGEKTQQALPACCLQVYAGQPPAGAVWGKQYKKRKHFKAHIVFALNKDAEGIGEAIPTCFLALCDNACDNARLKRKPMVSLLFCDLEK